MPRRIIIDTDPGKADAVAIPLALTSPGELELLSVVAVAGNVPLARTEGNARRLLELGGRADIPVYAGCAHPLVRPPITAEHVHGETGLHGLDLPEPAAAARAVATLFSEDCEAPRREREGVPLHDPCSVAHLLRPELFAGRSINVAVETSSPLTLGMTVVDWFGVTGRPANATYLNRADADAFFDLLFERLARLP